MVGVNLRSMFGSGGGQQQQQQQSQLDNEAHQIDEIDEENQEEDDPSKLLNSLFADEPEDEDEDEDDLDSNGKTNRGQNRQVDQQGGADDNKQAQTMAAEIQNMLKGVKLSDDAIPEDFNPSDPQQLRGVMDKAIQQGAMAGMQLTFKPMQAAMKQLATDLQSQMRSMFEEYGGKQGNEKTLARIVPEVEDSEMAPMVNGLFKQAMTKKGATAETAAQAVRKVLDGFGMKRDKKSDDPFSGGFKVGNDALDAFAPLKAQKTNKR